LARQPAWFERLHAALAELRTLEVPHIDRLTVERLFSLSRRDAIRLLHRFGATDLGNDRLELVRQGLIAQLEALQAGAEYRNWLAHQQQRQAELAAAAAVQSARRIRIPVAEDADPPSLARLPASIRLTAGRLEVSFGSEEDLWSQLEELARTAAADRAAFRARIEPSEE
jgi:hypothetical protein